MATLGILGSHLAGDFFLGVDILVTSMLVNFLLMALSVLTLPARNPALARRGHGPAVARACRCRSPCSGVVVLAAFPRRAHLEGPDRRRRPRGTSARRRSGRVVMAIGSVDLLARDAPRCAARGVDLRGALRERCRRSSERVDGALDVC